MTWKTFVYQLILDFCNQRGNRTFTLQEFQNHNESAITEFSKHSQTPFNTLRRVLQELRDERLISFIDNSGTYTLRGTELLNAEKDEIKTIDISQETPEKREYLVETYVRHVAWARQARELFGHHCMMAPCANSFLREDGSPYIEVHHIIPLCQGGEDGIWNLSVLCAHHHCMAHYADRDTRQHVQETLLREVQKRL